MRTFVFVVLLRSSVFLWCFAYVFANLLGFRSRELSETPFFLGSCGGGGLFPSSKLLSLEKRKVFLVRIHCPHPDSDARSLKGIHPVLAIPLPSSVPRSHNSPKLLWRLLGKLAGKLGVLGGVAGKLLRRLPLLCSSRQLAVSAAVLPPLFPALRVFPTVSSAVSTAVWGNSYFTAKTPSTKKLQSCVLESFVMESFGLIFDFTRSRQRKELLFTQKVGRAEPPPRRHYPPPPPHPVSCHQSDKTQTKAHRGQRKHQASARSGGAH